LYNAIGFFAASLGIAVVDDADTVRYKDAIARFIFVCIGMQYFENTPFPLVENEEIWFLILSACGCGEAGFGVGEKEGVCAIAIWELRSDRA
jgi:hypothetical protein